MTACSRHLYESAVATCSRCSDTLCVACTVSARDRELCTDCALALAGVRRSGRGSRTAAAQRRRENLGIGTISLVPRVDDLVSSPAGVSIPRALVDLRDHELALAGHADAGAGSSPPALSGPRTGPLTSDGPPAVGPDDAERLERLREVLRNDDSGFVNRRALLALLAAGSAGGALLLGRGAIGGPGSENAAGSVARSGPGAPRFTPPLQGGAAGGASAAAGAEVAKSGSATDGATRFARGSTGDGGRGSSIPSPTTEHRSSSTRQVSRINQATEAPAPGGGTGAPPSTGGGGHQSLSRLLCK